MKRLFVILIPLLPLILKAQLLNTVDQIATYNNPYSQLVFVKDTLRGGEFMPYNGSNPADNGMIFQDGLGRKWIRQSTSSFIDIRWFGAKADGSDCRAAIIGAINSGKVTLPSVKIYIPGSNANEFYNVSDSINIDCYIELFGDGYESKIKFAQHKKGITFLNPQTHYSIVRDITITSESSSASPRNTWDSTRHGIVIKSPVHFKGVWVSNFDGNGFHLMNSLNDVSNPGNSNTSTFKECHAYYNMLNGFYIKGADANDMTFENCDVVGNGAAGFKDYSFLGNHYKTNHTASNGSPELTTQRGLVKSGGTVYACIKDTTVGIAPPNTTYWQDIGTEWIGFENVLDYDANTVYWAVSGYILQGGNQYGTLIGNYSELDQAPGYIDYGNTGFGNKVVARNVYANFSAELGRMNTNTLLSSDIGVSSRWFYGGNMEISIDPSVNYSTSSGFIAGSSNKSSIIDLWDSGTRTGYHSTTSTELKTTAISGKKYVITADTTNIVGTLLNNGAAIEGGSGVSQSTLNDSTSALRTTIDTKQNSISLTTTGTSGAATLIGNTLNIPNYATGGPTRVFLPNDVVNNNAVANTIADVAGLSFPVVANNTYYFKFRVVYSSAATTTGSRWSINGPATTFMNYSSQYTLTATSITNNQGLSGYNTPAGVSASSLAANNIAIIEGIIQPSANGTVIARFASEITASAITAIGGKSYVEYQIID